MWKNGRADKSYETDPRRVRMGQREQLQAGPTTSSRSTKGRHGGFPEDASVQESTSQECKDVTGNTHASKTK